MSALLIALGSAPEVAAGKTQHRSGFAIDKIGRDLSWAPRTRLEVGLSRLQKEMEGRA